MSTRWKLRMVIRIVNETLNLLKVEQHPDKTFIGRVERGFDFLGYLVKPGVIGVGVNTIKRFALRAFQLYEQGADYVRIGEYVGDWMRWVRTGIGRAVMTRAKVMVKKHLHPSVYYEVCRCLLLEPFVILTILLYFSASLRLRLTPAPTIPTKPMPSKATVVGSGTGL